MEESIMLWKELHIVVELGQPIFTSHTSTVKLLGRPLVTIHVCDMTHLYDASMCVT